MVFHSEKKSGFTLIELIVSIGIMIIITSVILANYTTFNKRIKLEGATQEIASIIRQAQAYGLSSKLSPSPVSTAYGVHFDTSYPDSVTIFYDLSPKDYTYSGSSEDEEVFKIQSFDRIAQICVNQKTASPPACPGAGSVNLLDVIYERSKIFAQINNDSSISDAEITFRSVGETKGVRVVIWKSGQVSVEAE